MESAEQQTSLEALIALIADQRSQEAFATLFDQVAAKLKAYAIRCGSNANEAEEIVQEALLKVWHKAHTFNPKTASANTWLFTIVRNQRIDQVRKERPDLIVSDDLWPISEQEKHSEDTKHLEDQIESDLNARVLRTLISELPEEQRQIVFKVYFEGKSHSEIAAELELPLGTIKSRLRLAMKKTRYTSKAEYIMAYYHPSDELLMAFAAGQHADPLGILVACHIETCTQCREKVAMYERLGGELIDELDKAEMSKDSLSSLLTRIQKPYVETPQIQVDSRIPSPLRRFLPAYYDQLQWKGFSSSIKEFTLPISSPEYTAKFYKIAAGKELPVHTHQGNEYTLVMEGSFSDKAGDYKEGDFILANTQTIHQPKAAPDCDCICFAVLDAPLKMTGFFGRMLNPFL